MLERVVFGIISHFIDIHIYLIIISSEIGGLPPISRLP